MPPQERIVADLIGRLSSADPIIRETADDALYDLSPRAFPLMEAAAKDPNPSPDAKDHLERAIAAVRPLIPARLRREKMVYDYFQAEERREIAQYRTVGQHDPKWDAEAIAGIKAATTPDFSPLHKTAGEHLDKAIAAGCRDPLILLYGAYARSAKGDVANSHKILAAAYEGFAKTASDNPHAYAMQPAVWRDVNEAFQRTLRQVPNASNQSLYAWWACQCEQWDVANQQFKLLGPHLLIGPFGGRDQALQARAMAAAKASPSAGYR